MRPSSDRFELSPAVAQQNGRFFDRINPLIAPPAATTGLFSGRDTDAAEEVEHFRLWNYVAIMKVAEKAAEQFPNVGAVNSAPLSGRSLSQKQSAFLSRHYGSVLQAHPEEIELVSETHPLIRLFHHVNPVDWWGSFLLETVMFHRLNGAVYWWALPNNAGLPAELWTIPTPWVQERRSKAGELIAWVIVPDGDRRRKIELPPDEVIAWRSKNPESKRKPYSPLRAGSEWIDGNEHIEKARIMTYRNGPWPTGIMKLQENAWSNLGDEKIRQVGDKFVTRHGGVENAGRPLVEPPGIEIRPWSLKPQEMDFIESSGQVRDTVLALHGVPKAMLGITEDVNRAAIFGANLIFCETTINPLYRMLAGVLTEKLASRFDERLRVWFDDCRPEDAEMKLKEIEARFKTLGITPEQIFEMFGDEPPDDEKLRQVWGPISVAPITGVESEPEPPTDGGEDDEDRERNQRNAPGGAAQSAAPGRNGHGRNGQAPGIIRGRTVRQQDRNRRIHRVFRRVHESNEKETTRVLRRFWRRQGRSVLERFDQQATEQSVPTVNELLPDADFRNAFNDTMTGQWQRIAVDGAQLELDALGIEVAEAAAAAAGPGGSGFLVAQQELPDIEVELSEEVKREIRRFLEQRQQGVWSLVSQTTKADLARTIDEALRNGEGIREIRKRIESVLETSRRRATLIARTESTSGMNSAQQAVRQSEGVEQKVWISTLDMRTRGVDPQDRADHLTADGQVRDNGEPFDVPFGGATTQMMHPGDPAAPVAQLANCRCTASSHVEL